MTTPQSIAPNNRGGSSGRVRRAGPRWRPGDRLGGKPACSDRSINGGIMVMRRECSDRFLADKGDEAMLYRHQGFWQCMDTMRDRDLLDKPWADGNAPWADAR